MKILAISDLHGKIPKGLKKLAKDVDSIICCGDFADSDQIRKVIFKCWSTKKWWEVTGVRKAEKMLKDSFNSGINVMNYLNSLDLPVYFVFGNTDFYKFWGRVSHKHKKETPRLPGYFEDYIKGLDNFKSLHRKVIKLNEYHISGYGGYVDATIYIKENILDEKPSEHKKRIERYRKIEKAAKSVFENLPEKNLIYVTHWPPYNTKLDVVRNTDSKMNGKHIGFEPFSDIDREYAPLLHLCGHMHEYQGKTKIRETVVVNPGYGREGRFALIELNDRKPKLEKIEFVK